MTETLLSVAQVAALLNVSAKSIYGLLAPRGTLACVRTQAGPGLKRQTRGRVRVRPADLEAWINSHRSAPLDPPPAISRVSDLPGSRRYM